ncbi:hypothetical protein VFC49_09310 [Thermococcus sp. SY098]|uniref:hypothetical protein n=1 Tax=Thermococcus sp. SY098 TaxID=3111325 RepID=UPI002D7751E1|nr:hypothetical protein [Thermococcus sp. SY098]WRS52243.1 hypothetical protein VFC49_09310 [Thermococcus sp. SY098]
MKMTLIKPIYSTIFGFAITALIIELLLRLYLPIFKRYQILTESLKNISLAVIRTIHLKIVAKEEG